MNFDDLIEERCRDFSTNTKVYRNDAYEHKDKDWGKILTEDEIVPGTYACLVSTYKFCTFLPTYIFNIYLLMYLLISTYLFIK